MCLKVVIEDQVEDCVGAFFLSTQAQVEIRSLGPLLVVLVDRAWLTATKWGMIMNQVVRKSHKAPQGKMRFLISNKIPL